MTTQKTQQNNQTTKQYVIRTKDGEGFAENNPIEGWCFVRLAHMATKFPTRVAALDVVRLHYRNSDYPVEVMEYVEVVEQDGPGREPFPAEDVQTMEASKENARKALENLRTIVKNLHHTSADKFDPEIVFIRQFLQAAERKLPSAAAYATERQRRKK